MNDQSPRKRFDPTATSPGRFAMWLFRHARRVLVFVFGTTVLLIGIAMIVLPGPATIVIPLGLAILATEFVWARKWLSYAKQQIEYWTKKAADVQSAKRGLNPSDANRDQ